MALMMRRRWPRTRVQRDAELRSGDDLYVGTVLDNSLGGVFFRPEAGVIGGLFTQVDQAVELVPGTGVLLHQDGDPAPAPATVRWGGYSASHRCRGVGLETLL
jgi:hypothetical protein